MIKSRSWEGTRGKDLRTIRLDVVDDVRTLARLLQDEPDPRGRPVETDDIQPRAVLLGRRSKGAPPGTKRLLLGEFDELFPLCRGEYPEVLHPEEGPLLYAAQSL